MPTAVVVPPERNEEVVEDFPENLHGHEMIHERTNKKTVSWRPEKRWPPSIDLP